MDYSLLVGLHNVGFPLAPVSDPSSTRGNSSSGYSYDINSSQSARLLQPMQLDSGHAGRGVGRRSPLHSLIAQDASGLVGSAPSELRDANTLQLTDGGLVAQMVIGPGCYYLGLIDVLQQWTFSKKLERELKRVMLKDMDGISAIKPEVYKRRFQCRLREIIPLPDRLQSGVAQSQSHGAVLEEPHKPGSGYRDCAELIASAIPLAPSEKAQALPERKQAVLDQTEEETTT